ncbi:DUF4251 domain-containing protein [Paucihalobacter sp.]|uniref:DUF4251 domain-containing protein n=1 Tax=Paucihalobacter sp. TaxID=2850405 RepID=UPI002FE0B834
MKYAVYIITFVLLSGCSSSIKTYTEQEQKVYENLQNLVASKNFEIVAHTAMPMMGNALAQVLNSNLLPPGNTSSRISIIGTANSLRIKGDTIKGYLPFYGEQFSGGNPARNNHGISFNDVPEDYKVTMSDAKHLVDISFKIKDEYRGNERYDINITLFPSNTSFMSVQSSTRSSIQFSGNLKTLNTEDREAKE